VDVLVLVLVLVDVLEPLQDPPPLKS